MSEKIDRIIAVEVKEKDLAFALIATWAVVLGVSMKEMEDNYEEILIANEKSDRADTLLERFGFILNLMVENYCSGHVDPAFARRVILQSMHLTNFKIKLT